MQNQPYILIIEDAEELAILFAEVLQLNNMNAEIISDGAVAMERLAVVTPDLIMLDMHLPRVSGLQILDYIRSTPRLRQTKVAAITANVMLISELENKADLTLAKPVSLTQISDLVNRLLGRQLSF